MKRFTLLSVLATVIFSFCFQANSIAQYTGTGTFTKISSLADLTNGYYVIGYGTTFAMNNTNAGTYFGNTAISPTSNTITNPATAIVWLIQTHVDGGRTIYNEASAKYLSYTGTSNAAYAVASVTGGSERWTFAWSSTVFTAANVTTATRFLQYNTSSPRFACYTGTQQHLTLYKLSTPTPSIIVTPTTLTGFSYQVGSGPSTDQSFSVSGSALAGNISITPPADYEISLSTGGAFSPTNPVSLTPSNGSVASTPIYVRLKTGLSAGTYASESITAASSGAANGTVTCSGNVTSLTPMLTVIPTSLTGFTYDAGSGPSASQSYSLSGSNLTGAPDVISVSGSTNYEVSTDNTNFSTSVSVSYSSATLASIPIYVRLKSGLSAGNYNSENISNAGGGATMVNVVCSGTVTVPTPVITISGTLSGFGNVVVNGVSAEKSYSVSAVNLTTDLIIAPPAGFEISTTTGTGFVGYPGNITLTHSSGTVSATTIYVHFAPVAIQSYSGNISHTSAGAATQNIAVSGAGVCSAAAFPFYEDFDYAASALTANCWTTHSTGINPITVATNSISYPNYLSSGIGNAITLATSGEDDNRTFTAQTSGTIYTSFLLNVTSATTTGDYFIHLGQSTIGTTLRGRVFVKRDASNKLAFGIAQSTATANYSGFSYDLNTTYLIVLKYNIVPGLSNDVASIYINPALNTIEPTTGWLSNTDAASTDFTEVGSVALRQGSASNAPVLSIDGIRISTNWADIVGVIIPAASTFTGTGNWTNPANWSDGLPGAITNVTVSGNITVNDLVECNNLTVSPLGTVSISDGEGLLINGNLLIESSSAGTGSFIGASADYEISGTTTVQRYITKYNDQGDEMFHFLSSPVAAQAISTQFSDPSNNSTNDFFKFDESTYMWINYRDNAGSGINPLFESNFEVGRGYLVAYASDASKSFTGTLNNGTLTSGSGLPALSYTSGLGSNNAGWNLMGNPYPSAIDWDNVTSGQYSNMDDAVYVYDNASATYKSYVSGVGTLTDGIIPAMQGFFVHANAASPALSLENQDRAHSGTAFYKNDPALNMVRLKVEGNNRYDESIIRFADGASTSFDSKWDAYKLFGGSTVPQLYSTAGSTKFSVNSLPVSAMEGFVPLAMAAGANATYSISLVENTLPAATYITIEDLKTGVSQRLSNEPVYTFTAAPGDDANRFRLHFKDATSVPDPASFSEFTAYATNGNICITSNSKLVGNISVTDLSGRLIASRTINSGTTLIEMKGHMGIFMVSLSNSTGTSTQKVIVK